MGTFSILKKKNLIKKINGLTLALAFTMVPVFGLLTTKTVFATGGGGSTINAPSGFYFNKAENDTTNKGLIDGSITKTAPLEQFISGKNTKFLWAHWNIDNSATYHIETYFKKSDGSWKNLHTSNNSKPNPYRFYGFGSEGDGLYRIKVTAISKSNPSVKSSPTNAMLTYDTTAPQITSIKLDTIKSIDGKDYTSSSLNGGKLKVTITTNEPLKLVGSQVGFKLPGMAGPPSTGWTKFQNGIGDDTGKYVANIDITGEHFDNKKIEDASIYLRVVDVAGNTDSFYYYKDGGFGDTFSKRYLFTIDNQAPQPPNNLRLQIRSNGNFINNDGWTNKNDVTALWDSNNSEPVTYEYQYWNEVSTSAYNSGNRWKTLRPESQYAGVVNQGEGKHYFCVVAIDLVGNRSDCSDSFGFNYDATPPTGIASYFGGILINGVRYVKSITDLSFTANLTDNFNINRATYRAWNIAKPSVEACGNWNALSITNHNFEVPLALNASYTVNGNSIKTCDPSMQWLSGSRYQFIHATYDSAGNESNKFNNPNQLVEIDNTQPLINFIKPMRDTTVSGVVPVEVKITENGSGVKYVNALFADGPTPEFGNVALTLKSGTTDTYIGSINTAGKNGKYSLTINTADNLQNTRSAKAQNITIDNTAPATPTGLRFFAVNDSIEVTQNNTTIARQAVHPRWDAVTKDINNNNEDVDHYNYRSRGGYKTVIIGTDASADPTINSWVPPTDLTDGFRVQAVDKAGNTGQWSDWFDFTFSSVIPPEEANARTQPPQNPKQTPNPQPVTPPAPVENLPTPTPTQIPTQTNITTNNTPATTLTDDTNTNTVNQPRVNTTGQSTTPNVLGNSSNDTQGQIALNQANNNGSQPTVKSANITKSNDSNGCNKLLGVCWYYWVPVFIVGVIATWRMIAKSFQEEKQTSA